MAEKGCLKRLQKEYHALCKVSSALIPRLLDWGRLVRAALIGLRRGSISNG